MGVPRVPTGSPTTPNGPYSVVARRRRLHAVRGRQLETRSPSRAAITRASRRGWRNGAGWIQRREVRAAGSSARCRALIDAFGDGEELFDPGRDGERAAVRAPSVAPPPSPSNRRPPVPKPRPARRPPSRGGVSAGRVRGRQPERPRRAARERPTRLCDGSRARATVQESPGARG